MNQVDQVNAVSGKMDRNWNPRKLLALVTDRKDTLVRIRGAQCEVRLAGSALRWAISELNALNSINKVVLSRDSKEKGIAEMLVDLVKVDVDAED